MELNFLFDVASFWISSIFLIIVLYLTFLLITRTRKYYQISEIIEMKFLSNSLIAFFVSNVFSYVLKILEILERFNIHHEIFEKMFEILFIISLSIFIYYSSILVLNKKYLKLKTLLLELPNSIKYLSLFILILLELLAPAFYIVFIIIIFFIYLTLFLKKKIKNKKYLLIYLLFLGLYLLNIIIVVILDQSRIGWLVLLINLIYLYLFYLIFKRIYFGKK